MTLTDIKSETRMPKRPSRIELVADVIGMLNYSELLELAADLHSDSDVFGKTPHEVADALSRWSKRTAQTSRD